MSTEPAAAEETEPGTPEAGPTAAAPDTETGRADEGAESSDGDGAEATADSAGPDAGSTDVAAEDAEAAAERAGLDAEGADGTDESARPGAEGAEATADGAEGAPGRTESDGDGADEAAGSAQPGADGADGAAQPSEAEAELAAQRELRERIERRKADREEPIDSGAKLSGTAADLLAAVRAVESGEKPATGVFDRPSAEPAPRRPAPEPERRPQPLLPAPAGPAAPAPETVATVEAVLGEGGAPAALAPRVAEALGEGADGQLRADPWQLLRVSGVRPEQADGFARALLGPECGPDDERRGCALTVWLLEQAALAGHTALDAAALTEALGQRGVPDPDAAVQSAIAEADVLVFQDAIETPGVPAPAAPVEDAAEEGDGEAEAAPVRVLFGLERYALAEESLADGLARLVNSLPKEEGSGPGAAEWQAAAEQTSGSAAELIRAAGGHALVLHSGGEAARAEPAALAAAALGLGLRVCAAVHAPEGRRRLAEALGEEHAAAAVTVRDLLSGARGPGRDADGALAVDVLVVLDAPQLDVESAAMLVESLPDGARLVLSGDPGVLGSVGPGRVFADLLAARCCPQVVSRTPDPGPLGELVSGIGVGELAEVEAPGKEIVIVPVRDAGEAVHRTVQLVADSVPRAIGVPARDTQVITPGHGGAAGTRVLNAALKERLNPGPGRFGGFDPGDRVAHTPAAGRTTLGHVVRADAEGLHLECDGAPVVVRKELVERTVRHAWALTAHQAAGLRWPAAVVVLPGDAARSLNRPWVYTAFSRGERHLSVVQGAEQALPRAVAEVLPKPRTTRLQTLLRPQIPVTASS
ncbi:helix-hairpin-helix domain-containing protein [Actinomycetota bacterium Odt1-20B]